MIGAPRILYALGQNNILFFNKQISTVDKKGEPRFALYLTSAIVLVSLFLRDLNAIAPLLTMFFLITYAMINVVVLIEQGLGQLSFRPTLRVPFLVPLLGAIGCFFVMFIVNPMVAFISLGLIVAMYVYLTKLKNLETDDGDTRSGIFNSLAEWSAKVVGNLPDANERGWQPNLLVPAQSTNDVVRSYKTLFNLARPKGSVKILGFAQNGEGKKMAKRLPELCNYFVEQGISANSAIVENVDYRTGVLTSMQSLKASFFTPNTVFLSLTDDDYLDKDVEIVLSKCKEYGFGAYLFVPFRKVGLGLEKTINLWIDIREVDRDLKFRVDNINLGLLTAYLLKINWHAKMNIIILINTTENQEEEEKAAQKYMERLITLSRMPSDAINLYYEGDIQAVVDDVPYADLNILTLESDKIDIELIRQQGEGLETSCLYTIDSGSENALA